MLDIMEGLYLYEKRKIDIISPKTRKAIKKKVRLRFTKTGEARFISHLELAHLLYRASKRADLPLCHPLLHSPDKLAGGSNPYISSNQQLF
jgi:hypothetical protein